MSDPPDNQKLDSPDWALQAPRPKRSSRKLDMDAHSTSELPTSNSFQVLASPLCKVSTSLLDYRPYIAPEASERVQAETLEGSESCAVAAKLPETFEGSPSPQKKIHPRVFPSNS